MGSFVSISLIFFAAIWMCVQPDDSKKWFTNTVVADFAIGIYYENVEPAENLPVGRLQWVLNQLTHHLPISENQFRVAIVEFGDEEKLLLSIKDGTSKAKMTEAIAKIGQRSYTRRVDHVAKTRRQQVSLRTRELGFGDASDRYYVPKIVTIFLTHDARAPISRDFCDHGAQMLMMNSFDNQSAAQIALDFAFAVERENEDSASCQHIWNLTPPPAYFPSYGGEIVTRFRKALAICPYKKWLGTECHINENNDCVLDVYYKLSRWTKNDVNPPNAPEYLNDTDVAKDWDRVVSYCLKNGSTVMCPTGPDGCKLPDAKKNENEKDRAKDDGSAADDEKDEEAERLDNLIIILSICVGVLGIVDIPVVWTVCKILKEQRAEKKKVKEDQATKSAPMTQSAAMTQSVATAPAWTVVAPPEITMTPATDMINKYAALKTTIQPMSKKDVGKSPEATPTKSAKDAPADTKGKSTVDKKSEIQPKSSIGKKSEVPAQSVKDVAKKAEPPKAEPKLKSIKDAAKKTESLLKK